MTPVYKLSDARSLTGTATYYSSMLAGNTAFSPGSYDLLETTILTGTAASVTFSSLNSTYGSTYQHLQIRMTNRSSIASVLDGLRMRLGDASVDTGNNYASHQMYGYNGSVLLGTDVSGNKMEIGVSAGDSATSDVFSGNVIDILDPFETTKYTTVRHLGGVSAGTGTNAFISLQSGLWMNTAAVSYIQLFNNGGNTLTGSRFSLYGLKAA